MVDKPTHPAFDGVVRHVEKMVRDAHPRITIAYINNVLNGSVEPQCARTRAPPPSLKDTLQLCGWLCVLKTRIEDSLRPRETA